MFISILFFRLTFVRYKSDHFQNKFIKHETYFEELKSLNKLNKVVYSALFGKYDRVNSIKKENGYDYFMFTDQAFINTSRINWTILYAKKKIKYNINPNISIIKKQRFYKTHPHIFFKKYDLSIYIDSSYKIKGKLDEFLLRVLTPKINIYILEHPKRNSINKEFSAVRKKFKETEKNIISVKNKYNREKFPDNNGLAECCLIIRRHNELNSINFMNLWFNEIKKKSHRDQLSFNYILWKTGNRDVKYISKGLFLKYFQKESHLIEYVFK